MRGGGGGAGGRCPWSRIRRGAELGTSRDSRLASSQTSVGPTETGTDLAGARSVSVSGRGGGVRQNCSSTAEVAPLCSGHSPHGSTRINSFMVTAELRRQRRDDPTWQRRRRGPRLPAAPTPTRGPPTLFHPRYCAHSPK